METDRKGMELQHRGYVITTSEDTVTVDGRTFCGSLEDGLQWALDYTMSVPSLGVKNYKYRGSIHAAWAKMVKHRDGYMCQRLIGGRKCGKGGVEAHHIRPVSKGGDYSMENGITLCLECHKQEHK